MPRLRTLGVCLAASIVAGVQTQTLHARPFTNENIIGDLFMAGSIFYAYGWRAAIAPYVMSGVVAWQRVKLRKHYLHDVMAGALVSALFTWAIVDKYNVRVSVDTESAYLGFSTVF